MKIAQMFENDLATGLECGESSSLEIRGRVIGSVSSLHGSIFQLAARQESLP